MTGPPPQTIAVVGMSARFPGARSIAEYWDNLVAGLESITALTPEQLRDAGVPDKVAAQPHYVAARGLVPDHDRFDAAFFGYSPREAELMDPQQRLFLQHSYAALNDAGYAPGSVPHRVGVYAGATKSTHPAYTDPATAGSDPRILFGNEEDHLAARVAYKLGLHGPSLCVHTACSSSMVAVHLAVQALLVGDCDLALAGGVSVDAIQHKGHLYQEGGILSPDGHCRAFAADAAGAVSGGGVGVLVLRRYTDARADGDTVYALIRGTAVNNDGADRVGYTAPSVAGQAAVIAEALAAAEVAAETIGLIEAHGTATPVGDPIEVSALHRVFRPRPAGDRCALGSVKTNIGHLDAASGMAGLIKAVLAVRAGLIPPTLHFDRPNPLIDFADGPFHVNTEVLPWPAPVPRRAGVSSFGIGGTNVHAVVEQAPDPPATGIPLPVAVLTVSARTATAAETALVALDRHLAERPDLPLSSVVHTLASGREAFAHRRAVVRTGEQTLGSYAGVAPPESRVALVLSDGLPPASVADLPAQEPEFAAAAARFRAAWPGPGDPHGSIVAGYALAELLRSFGLCPDVVLGAEPATAALAAHLRGEISLAQALAGGPQRYAVDEAVVQRVTGDPRYTVVDLTAGPVPSELARTLAGDDTDRLLSSGASVADLRRFLAQAWVRGVPIAWETVHGPGGRVPLPGYPFEDGSFPLRRRPPVASSGRPAALIKTDDIGTWFWTPVWHQTAPLPAPPSVQADEQIILFATGGGVGDALEAALSRRGGRVTVVRPGAAFAEEAPDVFTVRPDSPADYLRLFDAAGHDARRPCTVLHLWTADGPPEPADEELEAQRQLGMDSLICLARALGTASGAAPVRLHVITRGVCAVTGAERLQPGNATLLGPCRVLPQELVHVRCRLVDVETPPDATGIRDLAERILSETAHEGDEVTVALRGARRWIESVAHLPTVAPVEPDLLLRRGGVYLITGGTGRVGMLIAERLAEVAAARLVIVSRSAVPREEWPDRLASSGPDDETARVIRRLLTMERHGAEVLTVRASTGDDVALRAAVDQAHAVFGRIDGVIHAAGATDGRSHRYLHELDPADFGPQFATKVAGTVAVDRACAADRPDFVLLMSSISVMLGGLRLGAYAGANAFLDAYAQCRAGDGGTRWLSVQWDAWLIDEEIDESAAGAAWKSMAMTPREGIEALDRLWAVDVPGPVIVSTTDLATRIARWVTPRRPAASGEPSAGDAGRWPAGRIAELWTHLLGVAPMDDDESFFAAGGDSLLALQFTNLLQIEFGVLLPAATLFRAPTVRALAEAVLSKLTQIAADDPGVIAERVAAMPDEAVEELLARLSTGNTALD
jgi:acyl transferase domain-containing protein/acyl carrier protein